MVRAAALKEAARAWYRRAFGQSSEARARWRRHASTFGDDLPTLTTRARQQSTPLPLSPHFNTRP